MPFNNQNAKRPKSMFLPLSGDFSITSWFDDDVTRITSIGVATDLENLLLGVAKEEHVAKQQRPTECVTLIPIASTQLIMFSGTRYIVNVTKQLPERNSSWRGRACFISPQYFTRPSSFRPVRSITIWDPQ